MLEQMRRSSQSLLIYVLFGIVIAVFVINFGPQSDQGCRSGITRGSDAAKVAGETVRSGTLKADAPASPFRIRAEIGAIEIRNIRVKE